MVALSPAVADPGAAPAPAARATRTAALVALLVAVAGVALTLPAWPAGGDMGGTHYMELLAANQPWNLLLFMAVPVVLAETVAVTELVLLLRRDAAPAWVARLSRWAGIVGGVYFVGVTAYLLRHAVVPLTLTGGWRGPADVVAVGGYLLGIVPLLGLALVELRAVGAGWTPRRRLAVHAGLVGLFLVVAHVAMIAGMLDPAVLGWEAGHVMPDGSSMHESTHGSVHGSVHG
ncbi:DUF6803 family protein [Cellulomonas marina]|uniref:Permease n=1 Tax=Cellulomonas marina TaxID=988821 RepID=A0A1I0Y0A3_9CELL|nr:DUF6803 family protein [Cellulomonas marina]GIG28422.1 permease [Cellulomonas marina]SFB06662.1 hypothetical protein SAMN05421867_10698 [Cellulomonas marina]